MPASIAIGKEEWNRATEVAPGFWIVATHHRPGGSRYMPDINNRSMIFRLRDQSAGGSEVLAVVNAVDPVALPEIERIARETGLTVRYLISPGSGHSIYLAKWHDALPEATVLVGPARIPRIAAGKKLASSPRFRVLDNDDPLPQFKGALEAVNFDGLAGIRETVSPLEGGKDTRLGFFKTMLTNMPPKDPHDELWLYHVSSRTMIGGENLGWNLSKPDLAGFGFMLKMMMKAEQVYVMSGARPPLDAERVRKNWSKVLAWPAENLISFHDSIGTGQVGGAQAALREAVEKVKQS